MCEKTVIAYKKYILRILLFFFSSVLFSQGVASPKASIANEDSEKKERVSESIQLIADPQLAMSVPNYPVTSGDVYSLVFAAGGVPVQYTIPVDTGYKVRVANLGVITCANLTYMQLKAQVEYLVSQNYPMAGTQFMLASPAVFLVNIKGEVKHASEEKAWALTRLSTFIAENTTPYSSTRAITVISAAGDKKIYDLYQAQRNGDFSQDPYLRPGDTIVVSRAERIVTIDGAVERSGRYELLNTENLRDLISLYASHATKTADLSRIRLVRIDEKQAHLKTVQYLSEKNIAEDFVLKDGDAVFVSDWSEFQPFIELKGIIRHPVSMTHELSSEGTSTDTMYKTQIQFYIGETYSSLIRRIKQFFTDFSDIAGIYIERNGEQILLHADRILAETDFESPELVTRNDVLFVPYLPLF